MATNRHELTRIGFAGLVACAGVWGQAGPTRAEVDPAAADRGKKVYLQYCVNCHGAQAKGTEEGPDLIRSVAVLHDKDGSGLAHRGERLAAVEARDLSAFLKQRVEDTVRIAMRGSPRTC